MEVQDRCSLSKVLNVLVRKFITILDTYMEFRNIDKNKMYVEVLKRSINISQGIRIIALNVLKNETAGKVVSEDILNDQVKALMESFLQQDLIECALNSKSTTYKYVTYGDLHDSLFVCSMNDMNSMTSSFALQKHLSSISAEDFKLDFAEENLDFFPGVPFQDLNSVSLTSQFDKSKTQFEDELLQLRLTLGNESPSDDFKNREIYSRLSSEVNASSRNTISYGESSSQLHSSQFDDCLLSAHLKLSSNNMSHVEMFSGSTWEGRMKQFVPCHLYSSELTGNEARFNVTDEDPQFFQLLYDSTTAISEDDMKHDVLDLLVGIPSNTFLYNNNERKFEMKHNVHLAGLSHESTLRLVEKFIESGTLFRKLQSFSTEINVYEKGLVLRGLKNGIQQILVLYTEYIMAVKMKKPSLNFLETHVLEAAQSLNILGTTFGSKNEGNDSFQQPKGLRLLSYLNESLWPYRRKENAIVIGLILKYAYTPYLNFLNKWMDEGICYDPFDEFQILEDFEYLDRKDELYWKFAYVENSEDNTRIVPTEIQKYAGDIMQCGKNMKLLKICCPQLYSLEFTSSHPSPSLSMLFSYCAASIKAKKCISYIQEKANAELVHSKKKGKISSQDLLVNNQCFVTRADIIFQNERRWNRLCFDNLFKFNSCSGKNSNIIRRCNSFENIICKPDSDNVIVYNDVGLLFSSCGYIDCRNCDPSSCTTEQSKDYGSDHKDFISCKQSAYNSFPTSNTNQVLKSSAKNINYEKTKNIPQHCRTPLEKNSVMVSFSSGIHSKEQDCLRTLDQFTEDFESFKVSDDLYPGTFMSSLAALLISDYGDSEQDVYSCLQLISLQSLMFYNFKAVLDMRMLIVKKLITDYVVKQLRLEDLLICLKNTYFLQDESFSQMLCEKLFPWVLSCQTTYEFSNWTVLNEIFCNSIPEIKSSNFSFLSSGSVNFVDLPENDILERNEFLHFFQFEFKINWPLNIIIHKTSIAKYMNIFSFLLELEFLCWLLGKMWRSLILGKTADIENSFQFREIMLNRFDMHQFICVLRNCIRHDLQGPVWDCLSKNLSTEELSIDALEDIHMQYLNQVLNRCFLTKETHLLHKLVVVMCSQIYKFCIWALESTWECNVTTKQYELSTFDNLCSVSETYKNYQKTFYDCIMKLTAIRKHEICNDDGFKQYLETILESKRK